MLHTVGHNAPANEIYEGTWPRGGSGTGAGPPRDGTRVIVFDASAWVDVLCGVVAPPPSDEVVVVPPPFDAEVLGALRALSELQVLTDEEAERAVDQHLRAGFTIERDSEDARQAWRWRASMSLPDAWCAALASRQGAPWVTTDHRTVVTARRFGVEVTELR